jgi:hypothetical protein
MYLVFIFVSLTLLCPAAKCVNGKANDKLIASYLVSNTQFFY